MTKEGEKLATSVRDHGPGVEKSQERRLFLPFHKSAREAAHSAPGVGLGLALCRQLAGELRGTIRVDHDWKCGAAFVLKLPLSN